MASNSFGKIFRITTWGESHGKAVGVVIDGCPPGLLLTEQMINDELAWRAPGKNPYTSPRKESDNAEIYSGVFNGQTTGTPISIIIPNRDAEPDKYESTKDLLKPGHANFTYLQKYGVFDYRGGGRASARETACRVAAGAVAKALLKRSGVSIVTYIKELGGQQAFVNAEKVAQEEVRKSPIFCPDGTAAQAMLEVIEKVKTKGDSVGGIVEVVVKNLPPGLGDPVYSKMEATLASALMSIPASKGFEIGSGFRSAAMQGSEHNDVYTLKEECVVTETNHAGGVLGGITTGMPLVARVAFKPTSSIKISQNTLTTEGGKACFSQPEGSRHDPCVAIRAVPVVEAMTAIVIADTLLYHQAVKFQK